MTLNLEEEIQISLDFPHVEVAKAVINEALETEAFPFEAEVNLTLTDLQSIQEMNQQFRNINRPTDVLSFPMLDLPAPGDFSNIEAFCDNFNPDSGEALLGDIVICIPRMIEQANEYGHSVKREYAFLIAHSMLHLMGYDHMEAEDADVMEQKQNAILDHLKISRSEA